MTVNLCSTTWGQAVMAAVVNPPKKGESSYELYRRERTDVLDQLKKNAEFISELINSIDGIRCSTVMGFLYVCRVFLVYQLSIFSALYAFPCIEIPQRAIEHAKFKNIEPDTFYCLELIESTGICAVPGNSFKQQRDTYHLRLTILASMDQMKEAMEKFRTFHLSFLRRWQT